MLEGYFIAKGAAQGRFSPSGKTVNGRSCADCLRRTMSFPDNCNDGWPMGDSAWRDKGSECVNYLQEMNREV